MGSAVGLGLALGGLSAANTLFGDIRKSEEQKARADTAAAQAAEYRRQAGMAEQKGRVEAENIELRKSELRRRFNAEQAGNRSMLAAGNVDMTSGSALAVSQGNINNFALDVGENAYQKALREWETAENAKSLRYQADTYDAQSSWLKKTAGNMGASLLDAAISGGSGFLSGYTLAGGQVSSLWNSTAPKAKYWDRALQQFVSTPVRH